MSDSLRTRIKTAWRAITTEGKACPDCGEDLVADYARNYHVQDHWRGVPAWVCEDCGYAEARDA